MIRHPTRHYGRGHLHFITFSCYHRLPLLRSARARNVMTQILGEVRDRYGFSLVGFVLMPEHVHLLISEPLKGTPSTVIQVLKQCVSRRLRRRKPVLDKQLKLTFHQGGTAVSRFWQRRFYDFNVWSLKKRVEKLHYMHMNPLKRGLVTHPKDWPWSSFLFYSKRGPVLVRAQFVEDLEAATGNPSPSKTARGWHPQIRVKGCATRPDCQSTFPRFASHLGSNQ